MKTIASTEDFKGNTLFAVYEEDENGDIGERPVVSFGKRKAKALLSQLEAFEEWCDEQGIE